MSVAASVVWFNDLELLYENEPETTDDVQNFYTIAWTDIMFKLISQVIPPTVHCSVLYCNKGCLCYSGTAELILINFSGFIWADGFQVLPPSANARIVMSVRQFT